jgi:class 3 adenylate cyclase
MGRRTFRRGELLLAVLGLLDERAMHTGEIEAALEARLGDEYRLEPRAVAAALAALDAERLVERAGPDLRITLTGREALARREGAAVLRSLAQRIEEGAILFTDVVGSTELLDRLGDEAAHELRRRHFALLRRAVRERGGREVKSLGDGLMVRFECAQAAVACADAMQCAVADSADPLQLRVGVASGELVREEGDYFGRPVVVARRLCDAAGPGEALVAGPAEDRLEPVGPLLLKGLREPVAAAALRSQPLAAVV